jgi:hypothetical protein
VAAVLPRGRFVAPVDAMGDRPLEPRVEGGVKIFDLETSVIEWHILPTVSVLAAFNRRHGPRLPWSKEIACGSTCTTTCRSPSGSLQRSECDGWRPNY